MNFQNLNDFILQEKIGNGSFGKVYRVKEKKSCNIYAAKISIYEINEVTENTFINISREVNIISKLNHPSVLKFIFYFPYNFKLKPKPVIITEYALNGSLSRLIEHDRNNPKNPILNNTLKLKIIYGIASAMSYLHSHNILHRDLKPDNILLDSYLLPKVADFGLSKSEYEENIFLKTHEGIIKGTPIYMSPEILSESHYSKSSDVYAFSIVVYEIMTFQKPYSIDNYFGLLLKIKNGYRPTFNVFVPEVYKNLIERCWSQDHSKRPTFDQILIELRNNREFLNDTVDENEYFNYIRFIDEYKTTFNSNKADILISFKDYKTLFVSKNDDQNQFKYINTLLLKHFPYKYFKLLCKESQQIVELAEKEDLNKQFEVGVNLIEGRYDFPIDVQIGIDFLKRSINKGHKASLFYYIKMLIKGEYIPANHHKVCKLIDTKLFDDKSIQLYFYGKLYKKEKRYLESSKYFKQSIKMYNNSESMYEYAELLRKSLIQPTEKEDDFIKYYKDSIELNNTNSMYKYGLQLIKENKISEGMKLIKQAADLGNIKAMYFYATKLEEDESKLIDLNEQENIKEKQSMIYFKRSADLGYVKSMNKYGVNLLKYYRSQQKYADKEEPLRYIKKGSDKGCFESMYEYGFTFTGGDIDIDINCKEGCRYIKIASDNNYPDALAWYGTLLREGRGVEINHEESIKYYKKSIEKGSVIGMNEMGYIYQFGQGCEVNYEEAIKYYKMAIDKGFSMSMNNYAFMLQNGQGCEVNSEEAIKYYKMAIDKGNSLAMCNYAFMLQNGQGCEVNSEEAIKYYKMAIDKGNSSAMCCYGVMLENGQGCEVNSEEAIKYYKMAIDKGNSSGYNYLGLILMRRHKNEDDFKEALKCFKIAIDKGSSPSISNYAWMLEHGLGTDVNYKEAFKYYKMAFDNGNNFAIPNVGRMYRDGLGVDVNYEEAIKYFKMGINNKNYPSMNHYGYMLEKGLGVDVNYKEAIKYYKMAIDGGYVPAMTNYANLLYVGKGVEINKEEAIKLYKLAISKKNADAMLKYGMILFYENESNEIKEEGFNYIKNAAYELNTDAMYQYSHILEEYKFNDINKSEIIKYYEEAAKRGNKDAEKALKRIKY